MTDEMMKLKAEAFDNLLTCLGHVQNGSDQTVTISQDDATMSFVLRVGRRAYHEPGLMNALEVAADKQRELDNG